LSVHTVVARLSSISHCTFDFDNRLSSRVRHQIVHAIEQRISAGDKYHDIVASVTKTFSCIDDISIHHCAPGVIHCDVTSVHPLIQVNDARVVSDSGALLAPDCFSPMLLKTLHTMRVDNLNNEQRMPESFVVAIKALIPSLLDTYEARWIDDKKMILQEKLTPHFSVVCNAQTVPNEQVLAYCQRLKDETYAKYASSKKVSKMQQWSADIRFEHQIVLACPTEPNSDRQNSEPKLTSGIAGQGGVAHG
jgi:hypothetical protein